MNRRQYLGAAAALAALPGPTAAADPDANPGFDVTTDDYGSGRAGAPDRSSVWSSVELFETVDDQTLLSVNGYWYDDEEPEVEVTVSSEHAGVTLSMSPKRAQQLAADLRLAATNAIQGDAELGGGD